MSDDRADVPVADPFHAAADAQLPTVAQALDPTVVSEEFHHRLTRLTGEDGRVSLRSIEVIRHKPGKRCVIAYGVRVKRADGSLENATLLGKIRARRYGNEGYRLQDALWHAGFPADSADQISVPEPIAAIPPLRLWLQRKVRGAVATTLLAKKHGVVLARFIAEALHKLHRAGVPAERAHTMADELRILHDCLARVAASRPQLAPRIEKILAACDRLGASVPAPRACGIHRDFYPAQVLAHHGRLWLIDFDLYCQGDPALDAGNFLGHVIEESLRTLGDPAALRDREEAMEERFVALSGAQVRPAVRAYTTLTLARHVYLSTQFPERTPYTERLVELCERRLG